MDQVRPRGVDELLDHFPSPADGILLPCHDPGIPGDGFHLLLNQLIGQFAWCWRSHDRLNAFLQKPREHCKQGVFSTVACTKLTKKEDANHRDAIGHGPSTRQSNPYAASVCRNESSSEGSR